MSQVLLLDPSIFVYLPGIDHAECRSGELRILCRAYFQHRHDPAEVRCHRGSCDSIFYYGSEHAVTCELYSQRSAKWMNCFKEFLYGKRNATPTNQANLSVAVGGMFLSLLGLSVVLFSSERVRRRLYRVAKVSNFMGFRSRKGFQPVPQEPPSSTDGWRRDSTSCL